MILLKSIEENSESDKFDFVHPSYHEAFWYAIKEKSRLLDFWEILKKNITEILDGLDNKLDNFQLDMIENYGIVNRDLDQLLLVSAKSKNVNEQFIALTHMMERVDAFIRSPYFLPCVISVISSQNSSHKLAYINLLSNCFNSISAEILDESMLLLVDCDDEVRKKYIELVSNNLEILRQQKTSSKYTIWPIVEKIQLIKILQNFTTDKPLDKKLINSFTQITPNEFNLLFRNDLIFGFELLKITFFVGSNQLSNDLSLEQKRNLNFIMEDCIRSAGYSTKLEDNLEAVLKLISQFSRTLYTTQSFYHYVNHCRIYECLT